MSNNFPERRKYPRFDLEYTIQLISPTGDMVITALTSNISDGGFRLALPWESLPDCGKEAQVHLILQRGQTGEVEKYIGFGRILRHSETDEEGVAEIAVKFFAPMNLRLHEENAVPSF